MRFAWRRGIASKEKYDMSQNSDMLGNRSLLLWMYVENKEKISATILNRPMVSWTNATSLADNFAEIHLSFTVLILEWNESRRGSYVGLKPEGNE